MKLKFKAQHHLDAGTAEVSSVVDFCLMQCSPSASRVHPLSSKQPMEQQAEKVQLFTGWVLAILRRAVADQPAALMSWTDQRGLLLTNYRLSCWFCCCKQPLSFSCCQCQDAVLGIPCGSHVRSSSRSPQGRGGGAVQRRAEHDVWHCYGCRSCRITDIKSMERVCFFGVASYIL